MGTLWKKVHARRRADLQLLEHATEHGWVCDVAGEADAGQDLTESA
jgi:hypothetical protein